MNVLVLGSDTLMGEQLMEGADPGLSMEGMPLEVYITEDFKHLRESIGEVDWVINCAFLSDIDGAESERATVFHVNMDGTRMVADVCRRRDIRMLQLSSHYVFDGMKPQSYTERDIPNPLNVYGSSMLAGEKAVRSAGGKYLIVRAQNVYGRGQIDFINSTIGTLSHGDTCRAIDDELMVPTCSTDLVSAMFRLMDCGNTGLLHLSAGEPATPYEIACSIRDRLGTGEVEAVSGQDVQRAACHPKRAVLTGHWFEMWTGKEFPVWQDGLERYMSRL